MRTASKMWMAIAVVFLSGIVVGFFGGQMYLHWRVEKMIRRGPVALQEYMLRRMTLYLRPSAGQVQALNDVLGRVAQEVNQRREKGMAEQWVITKQALQQMQPPLTAQQQQVLDRMNLADLLPGPRARILRSQDGAQP
jgi:uncharacterized protein YneF (UPF0154 family)